MSKRGKMTQGRPRAFLVTKMGNIEKGISKAIKADIGSNPSIKPIRSHQLFRKVHALSTFVQQNRNLGKVYVIEGGDEMLLDHIRAADETDVPFGVLFRDKDGIWTLRSTVQEVKMIGEKERDRDHIDTVA